MTMWMVRAERGSRLFQPFMEHDVAAIGWSDAGELDAFSSREAIMAKVQEQWPDWKQQRQINATGMLYRFSKQMEPGDRVITYDQSRRVYAVGAIVGPYRFDPNFDTDYPNVRPVKWEATEISRDDLSISTKNSLGSTLTLFLLPEEAERDVLRVVEGGPAPEIEDVISSEEKDLLQDTEARSPSSAKITVGEPTCSH